MTQLSRYRAIARKIISEVLSELSGIATEEDAKRALRKAKPPGFRRQFSGDGCSWASQCWSREQREALRKRFPPAPMTTAPTIGYRLQQVPWKGRMSVWLSVACGWCEGDMNKTGCLLCASHCQRVREVIANSTFQALREAAACTMTEKPNPDLVGVLCDWLEDEAGITVER